MISGSDCPDLALDSPSPTIAKPITGSTKPVCSRHARKFSPLCGSLLATAAFNITGEPRCKGCRGNQLIKWPSGCPPGAHLCHFKVFFLQSCELGFDPVSL